MCHALATLGGTVCCHLAISSDQHWHDACQYGLDFRGNYRAHSSECYHHRNCYCHVSISGCCCLYDLLDLPALVMGAQDWGSARQTNVHRSGQNSIPHHCDCSRSFNAPNTTILLELMFASHGNKKRLFLIPTFLDLMQVLQKVVAQVAICHSALICVVHPLADHWNARCQWCVSLV